MAVSELVYLLCLALAGACLPLGLWLIRRWGQRTLDKALATYELTFPRNLDDPTAARVFTALSGLAKRVRPGAEPFGRNTIVFELLSTPERLHYLLSFPPNLVQTVESHLTGVIPDIGMKEATVSLDYDWRYVVELKRNSLVDDPHAARSGQKQRPVDPKMVEVLLRSTRNLKKKEAVLIQFVMTPTGNLRDDKHPEFWAVGRLAAAGHKIRARQLLGTTLSAYRTLHVFADRLLPTRLNRRVNERRAPARINGTWPGSYIPEELAVMCGLPIGSPEVPGLVLGKRRLAPDMAISRKGIVLAESNFPGRKRPLALSPHDLTKHMHIVGEIGTGKSTFNETLLLQHMDAGGGFMLMDPHRDSVYNILDRVPRSRLKDVIVLDLAGGLTDTDDGLPVVGFNALAGNPYVVTDQVMTVFDRLYGMSRMAQTNEVLRSAVLALAHNKMTLMDIPAVLAATDDGKEFRRRLVKRLTDRALREFWHKYEEHYRTDRQKLEVSDPVLRRLSPFAMYPNLRRCLGQAESGFDFDDVLRTNKIVLVNLSIGEEQSKLFGSLFVAHFWNAIQRRAHLPIEQRTPYILALDEFHRFVNFEVSFANVLAESRKYGLSFLLAHQGMYQVPHDLRQAIMTNARNKTFFKVSADDASMLAREVPGLSADDLLSLGRFEVIMRLVNDDAAMPPVSARTLALRDPLGPEPGQWAAAVKAASLQDYGKPVEDVDSAIENRQTVTRKLKRERPIGDFPVGDVVTRDATGDETDEQEDETND